MMDKLRERLGDGPVNALDQVLAQIQETEDFEGLKTISRVVMNALMAREREAFLRRSGGDNKGNGFYSRRLASGLGSIDLSVPRDRLAEFRPFLLPESWQRGDQSVDDLMASLLFHAYSPNKIRAIFKDLGLPYSNDDLDELQKVLEERSRDFKTRELDESALALIIDAYHTGIKDPDTHKVKKAVIHTVLGLGLDGKKEVLGYYEFAGAESRDYWLQVLNDLISRGLKKVLVIVSDDFPGLTDALSALYPKTDHQLCLVHLMRNARRHLGKADAKEFNETLRALRILKDPEQAKVQFDALCARYEKSAPHFIRHIRERRDRYFAFLGYPRPVQKHLYTTNAAENFNSRLEVLRLNLGGYFHSDRTLLMAVQVLVDKIHRHRWKKPLPALVECEYEIYQMFRQRFP
jgi:transposase-like protein